MIEDRQRKPVAVCVIVCEHSVIAGRRVETGALNGLVEFPGGHVEPGESPEMAARRELLEETGLAVTNLSFLERVDHDYPDRELSLYYFMGNSESPRPLRSPWRWCPIPDLGPMPAANRPIVEYLGQRIVAARWNRPSQRRPF